MHLTHKYLWAELSQISKKLLEDILPYRYDQQFGTHITIDWDADFTQYTDIIGKKFKLTVDTLVFDQRCEAIPVTLLNTGLFSINKNPHITWSCDIETNPYYSNYLLFVSNSKLMFEPLEIEVEVICG